MPPGLTLAQVLTDVAKLANDEKVDGSSRVWRSSCCSSTWR